MELKSVIGRRALTRISLVYAFVLVVSFSMIGALAVIAARSQDQLSAENSIHLARSVLSNFERQLAIQLTDFSYWDQAVDNLVTTPNSEWADANVGIYAHDTLGVTSSFVLDANDETVYAMIGGKRHHDSAFDRFEGGLGKLLARARAAPSTEIPKAATGFLKDDDVIHFAAVSRLTTYVYEDGIERPIGTNSLLIFTKSFDAELISEFSKNYLLNELVLAPAIGPFLSEELPLVAPDGVVMGVLTWRAAMPGQDMLTWLIPLVVATLIVFAGTTFLFVRDSTKITVELNQQIDEIRKAHEALRKSENRNREFAANAAHELRTPLAYFRSHLDDQPNTAETLELCQEVDSMARLVEQLLALTRAESISVEPGEDADLRAICIDVAGYLAPLAIKENRTIEVVGTAYPVKVNGSAGALDMALRNLVENAIKYSDEGTTITIDVSEDGTARVIDVGPGIPEGCEDTLFDRHFRFDNRASGFGLGLQIVRRIAESHGGSVEAGNNPNGGAEFTIRLPIAA